MHLSRLLVALAALLPCAAHADAPLPLWEAGAGVGVLVYPDYRGARHDQVQVLPFPYVIYRGERFKISREELRAELFDDSRYSLNLSASASLNGNDDSRDAPRAGMPDLLPTFEIGPRLDYRISAPDDAWRVRARLPVRAVAATDLSRFETAGWVAHPNLEADRRLPLGDWTLGISGSMGLRYATRQNHAYFYEVAPQYATPTRPAYRARAGYSGATAGLFFALDRGPLRIGFGFATDRLEGTAFEDSPLVQQNHAEYYGVALIYRFWRSDAVAPADDTLR